MILAATLTLALAAPQLRIEPSRAVVGSELEVDAGRADLEIVVELPDGARTMVGRTDPSGKAAFTPAVAGTHVFRAEVDGVLLVAPCRVVPAQSRWVLGAVCVPLGLALLWRAVSRARDRRDR